MEESGISAFRRLPITMMMKVNKRVIGLFVEDLMARSRRHVVRLALKVTSRCTSRLIWLRRRGLFIEK